MSAVLTMTRDEFAAHIDYVILGKWTPRPPPAKNYFLGPPSVTPSELQVRIHERAKSEALTKFDADGEAGFCGGRYVKTDHPVPGWGQKPLKFSEAQGRMVAAWARKRLREK